MKSAANKDNIQPQHATQAQAGNRYQKNFLLPVLGVVLFALILCPLAMILMRTVFPAGRLDFSAAIGVIATADNVRTIANTLLLGGCVVLCSTLIALPLAFITTRTQLTRHSWLDTIFMIPFMTPPYIASMGWILFVQRRGLFQQLFPMTGAWSESFISFGGLVLVMSLHVFPFMLTILKNALRNVGAGLVESAAIFGGGMFYRLRRVTLPLLSGNYAIGALLVFVKTISEYGTPATLGRRIGFSVFATDIHRYATVSPIDFAKSSSLSTVLIALCLGAWMLQNHITTRKSYRLIGGRGARQSIKSIKGGALAAAWGTVAVVLLVSIGIPYFSVLCTSLIKLRGYGIARGNFTFDHYIALFTQNPRGRSAFVTSIVLAFSSASIAAVLGTLVAMAIRQSKSRLRKVVEAMGLLPEMLPGIVFVIGIMLFWNGMYRVIPLYNTLGIMVLAYVTLFLPYTIQYVTSSFTQISDSLIQAGRVMGGSPLYTFRRVTLPLLMKGVLTGWIMTFIISFRELVTASLIAPPNVLVISTFISREFEQGSVSVGMAMATVCVLFTTGTLLLLNRVLDRRRKGAME